MGDTTPIVEAISQLTEGDLQKALTFLIVVVITIVLTQVSIAIGIFLYPEKLLDFMRWITND